MSRYSNSIWRPTDKFGYGSIVRHTEGVKRVIIHSAEGYRAGMFATLDGSREASWHFSLMKNGEVYQHISTANIAWTASSFDANNGSIQFEEEGRAGEALTNAQYASTIALLTWVFRGYDLGTPSRKTNLREHNEFANTSCPSGRIPWARLITDLTFVPTPVPTPDPIVEEDDMLNDEDKQWLEQTIEKYAFKADIRQLAREAVDDMLYIYGPFDRDALAIVRKARGG